MGRTRTRARTRGDAGANALEVVGIVLISAGVIVGLAYVLPEPVTGGLRSAVCRVVTFGDDASCDVQTAAGEARGSGSGEMWPKGSGVPNPDRPYMPTCLVESASVAYTADAQVIFIETGGEIALMRQVTIDPDTGEPTVTIQAVNAATLGAGTGVGGEINSGSNTEAAEASVSAALGFAAGDGWEFTGADADAQADALVEGIMERAAAERVAGTWTGDWASDVIDTDWATDTLEDAGWIEEIPDPTLHSYQGSFEASAGADVGIAPGYGGGKKNGGDDPKSKDDETEGSVADINAGAYVGVDAAQQVTYETNDTTGESSVTYMLRGGANAGANWVSGGANGEVSATGSVKVTENADGSIKSVTFTQAKVVGGELVETVTEVEPRTDAERETLSEMFSGFVGTTMNTPGTAFALTWDDMAPTQEPGEDANDFARLIYEAGKTSRVSYDYDQGSEDVGFSARFGVEFGLQGGTAEQTQEAHTAEYLGAPGADGTREYVDYDACEAGVRARGRTDYVHQEPRQKD